MNTHQKNRLILEAKRIIARAPQPKNALQVVKEVNERMRQALKNYKSGETSIRTLNQITRACSDRLRTLEPAS